MKKCVPVLLLICLAVLLFPLPGSTKAGQDPGASEITLDGGNKGNVPFPHRRHQETLVDCAICHSYFPQEAGAIERLKKDGTLKQKTVMNKVCTNCHRRYKKEGKKSGPTKCSTCHIK